ncbi:magnesium-translocating P-type ATPase [Streptomyces hesseae]|uniref:Magnesium-transporting ATPase, P-type 1 n=1 Tax=Streptomyces hesseae TaxID=3075519 RepID=A0ABU2SRM5_9ACTN|nr:magnesium-translocating P-type ATPase [Streptomyces sp. DSM 40473]MDT0450994.1 magnesium-translocating P-type ATPase [Streptomyces sp. DSM 40473]
MVWAPEARTAPGRDTGGTSLEVLRALESGPRGLTEAEAEDRLARHGENVFPGRRPASWPRRFARSLRDPFTAVLIGLGLVSALMASWGTACVIAVLVTVSCVLRATGEHRADRSAASLRELVATTATVRRRATESAPPATRELPVEQLVPGDLVLLGPGDLVPADLRLLRATGLTVHEAALTGESAPADKAAPAATTATAPGHLCFQGSSVVSGTGSGVVVATGRDTVLSGALPASGGDTNKGKRLLRPFDRSVNGIAWTLIRFMLLTAPLVLLADALVRGRGLATLPFAVAVAVGLTPEMLPVIVTSALARGAALLARDGEVIVRRLPALHDLGAVDVLCVDKTGTLTEDRPVLALAEDPEGHADQDVLRWAAVNALWTLHLAELPVPDALDEAVLEAGDALGDDPAFEGVDALPCGPGRRLSTAVVRRPGDPRFALAGTHTLVVKGAPEDVLDRCALDPAERARLTRRADDLAAEGLRVLAVARAERPARDRPYTEADERDLTFTGFVGLSDAPAPTAAEALAGLARNGVTVKVLTGDHPGTAARVCRELGLDPGTPVTGDRIDALDDAELARLAAGTTVFARCAPAHKARVVGALRGAGHTTGFLGDGVNDLAALHAADVGVCPRDGVDVAREAADVVLASKDLTSLDRAIVAGRGATANISAYLRITLSSNFGNVIAMLVAGLMLPFLPMLPAQVLVQNLFFDAAQLSLAFDRQDDRAHTRPAVLRPRALLRFVTGFGLLNAAADLATFAVLALAVRSLGAEAGQDAFHAGWFTENLLTQAMVMALLRSGRAGAPRPVRAAVAGLAVVGLLLPVSPLGSMLSMSPLPALYYGLLALVLVVYGCALTVARSGRFSPQPRPFP